MSRQPHKIARNPTDEFALTIHGFGTSAFTQLGRNVALKPGDLVLHDMDRPFEISFDAEWSQTIVLFPRTALLSRLGSVECHMGARIDGAVGVASVLSPLLQSLPRHLDRISGDARERLADNVLDLIATAILFACGQPCRSRTTTLARVKLWIENHLGEAPSAELIAAQCGLSTRHLNRLFAREETSLMQYVSEQRLARCHRDLADPTMRGRSITDIALAAGFNDLSHFSRSYRARYGRAPKELRRAAMAR